MFKHGAHLLIGVILLWPSLTAAGSEPNPEPFPPIVVGGSMQSLYESSRVDVEIVFSFIYGELLRDLNQEFTFRLYDNNQILEKAFRAGDIQIIFIDSTSILKLDSLIHPEGRYVVQYGDSLKQRFVLLKRRDSSRKTLADFRDTKLATVVGHLIGKRYLDVLLMRSGLPVTDHFFNNTEVKQEVNSAIIDLYFGKVDMALVPEYGLELARELNPQVGEELLVMARSEPLIYQAVGFRTDIPTRIIQPIEARILDQEPPKRLKRIFDMVNINTFYRLTEEVLTETRELNEAYEALINPGSMP